jgi:hypothetical protein
MQPIKSSPVIFPINQSSKNYNMKQILFFLFAFTLNYSWAQTQTTRTLSAFDKLALSGGFDKVILKEGDSESVYIESKGVDAEKIKTEVKDNTLKISMQDGSDYNNVRISITVTYRQLRAIANSGSSDIEANSVIKSDVLKISSSGSGDVKANLEVGKLSVAISGSSDMAFTGKATEQEISISGSGDVDCSNLKGTKAEVAISGSGDVKLNVDGPVRTRVSGSGDVTNN